MLAIIRNVEIRPIKGTKCYLHLSEEFSHFNIENNAYLIKAGAKEILADVEVLYTYDKNNICFLNEETFSLLHLPERIRLNMKREGDALILGPIIGVLIGESKVTYLNEGGHDRVFWWLQNWAAEYGGLVYFFMYPGIDWEHLTVSGYCWNEDKAWIKTTYPLSEVVYDRCFEQGSRKISNALRKAIANKRLSIKVFNQALKVTKIEAYQHLMNYPDVNDHLPTFSPYTPKKLRQLMNEFESIYIKPNNFYKGKGVMKVTKKAKGFEIEFSEDQTNRVIFCQNLKGLLDQINLMLLKNKYVLQAEIPSATFLGNRFDVRVKLQKREPSLWETTEINARIAPVGSVITSPLIGGKALRIEDVLALSFPGRGDGILEQIKALSVEIGYKMEDKYNFLGELNIDLEIDIYGKVWIIGVNSRPLKVNFNVMKDNVISKVIYQNPIFLGFSMCGFNILPKNISLSSSLKSIYSLKLLPEDWKYDQKNGLQKRILFLNPQQIKAFRFNPGQRITLQVGFSSVEVRISRQEVDLDFNTIYLSRETSSDLPYYNGESVNLIMISDCQLVLQATVGMTISAGTWNHIQKTNEMKKIALHALEKGTLFYCFCPDRIDWDKREVAAYLFNPSKKSWDFEYLPFPQILYDMATFPFGKKKRVQAKQAIKTLRKDHKVQLINSMRYFGKWETYEALSFFTEINKNVPETSLLSPLALIHFLDTFDFIFVKSNYGSFGKEVLRVERKGESYLCRTGGAKVKEWKFKNTTDLYQFLVKQLGTNAIVQKGISLAKLNDRIFDMRVLCQKNNVGQWGITALNFRIAPPGGVVTNYSAGAEEILVVPGDKMPYESLSWENVSSFSKKVVLTLEASFGLLGEIGLDVGVDIQGNLWLIEANSKPNTRGYRQLTTEDVCSQVYGHPLDYALFLVRRMYEVQDL